MCLFKQVRTFFELMKKIETGTFFEYVNKKIEKSEIVFVIT